MTRTMRLCREHCVHCQCSHLFTSIGFNCLIVVLFILGIADSGYAEPESAHKVVINHSLFSDEQIQTVDPNDPNIPIPYYSYYPRVPHRDEGHGELNWQGSDENAISGSVAMSANGNWIAIGYSLNDERLEVRSAQGGLQIEYRVADGPSYVDISGNGNRTVFSAVDSVYIFELAEENVPVFRFRMEGHRPGPVAISRDGRVMVCTGADNLGRTHKAWCFVDDELSWTVEVNANQAYSWQGVTLARDGSVAVLTGKYHMYVVDLESGEIIWNAATYNTESPAAVSADGSVIVLGTLTGRFMVFGRNGNGYEELWHYNFRDAPSTWVNSCAVSADGLTVAAGTLDFFDDRYEGRMALFDTYGIGQPLWMTGPLQDEVSDIAINDNGTLIAAVSWGDFNHQTSDFIFHERHDSQPFYTLSTAGSMSTIGMSDDGSRVVFGGKGTHSRQFGRGGLVYVVSATQIGATVTGRVVDRNNRPIEGVELSSDNSGYEAITDAQGNYRLLVEVEQSRLAQITASMLGYTTVMDCTNVVRNQVFANVNFTLQPVDDAPAEVAASNNELNRIVISWDPYNGIRNLVSSGAKSCNGLLQLPVMSVGGRTIPEAGPLPSNEEIIPTTRVPHRDESDDAESINIYRGYMSGGPYTLIGSVDGNEIQFIDQVHNFPLRQYYYVITAKFSDGESVYSDEVQGALRDDYLVWDAELWDVDELPVIDGTIDPGEWDQAAYRDISDVLGYDAVDTAGTTDVLMAFDDETDQLLLAFRWYNVDRLHDRMGVGVYIDDDGNGLWAYDKPGTEGNYWGYWFDNEELHGPDLRYRSLTGPPHNAEPYYIFDNPSIDFSDDRGYVEMEMAIPLGFREEYETAIYSPHKTIGLGLFTMHRDEAARTIFDGWWPQNMFSIVTNPEQFAQVRIPVTLPVPPAAPQNLQVSRNHDEMWVEWTDPEFGIDNGQLDNLEGINIYRNGRFIYEAGPGEMEYFDETVIHGGWYEYAISGFILDADEAAFEGPISSAIGMYAGEEPHISEIIYDDGTPESWYVVSFDWNDNKFAVRYDIEGDSDSVAVYWIDFIANAPEPVILYVAENAVNDTMSYPGEQIGNHYQVTPERAAQFYRFHFPDVSQPVVSFVDEEVRSFWVVIEYLEDSPGAPGIGLDRSSNSPEKNFYHLGDRGWGSLPSGQLMVRIGTGRAPASIPPVNETPGVPERFSIEPNFPNPFNSISMVPINIAVESNVKIQVYDLAGRLVQEQDLGLMATGRHVTPLDANRLSTGLYLIRVSTPYQAITQKMAVVK